MGRAASRRSSASTRASGRDLRYLRRVARARARRGRVPGDVPAGTPRYPGSARPTTCARGRSRSRRASRSTKLPAGAAARWAAELAGSRRPAYAELEHLADELPPTERAAVVLRYGYDLPTPTSPPRSARARRLPVKRPRPVSADFAKEVAMTVSPQARRRFREAAAAARAARRGLRPHRLTGGDAARRRPSAASAGSRSTPSPSAELDELARPSVRASCARRDRWTDRAGSLTSTSRAGGREFEVAGRPTPASAEFHRRPRSSPAFPYGCR